MKTLEHLNALRDLMLDIASTRALVFSETAPVEQRDLARQRLALLTEKQIAMETPPPPPPLTPLVDPKMSREEAAARATAIRKDPRFWEPLKRDGGGRLLISREEHETMIREVRELDAHAAGTDEPPTT